MVISIIGILAGLSVASFSGSRRATRDGQRKVHLSQVRTALESYYSANGVYPTTSNGWWGTCSDYGSHPRTGANGYVPGLAPDYIDQLPIDPTDTSAAGGNSKIGSSACGAIGAVGGGACYVYKSEGTDYKLLAHCTPESFPVQSNNPFYDPSRPSHAWQVHSSPTSETW